MPNIEKVSCLVSWQVAPTILNEMLRGENKEKVEGVTNAFLKMKKFDIGELKKAYEGQPIGID